jgi:hypothetical protein
MHLSVRSKVGAFFSLFAILTMVSALIVAFATHGAAPMPHPDPARRTRVPLRGND